MTEQLVELLKRLEEVAPHVWAIYVRQQYVVAAVGFIWTVVLVVFAYVLFRLGRWAARKGDAVYDKGGDYFGWTILEIFMFVFCALALVIIPFVLTNGVMRIINPQYYAIDSLLSIIK